MGVTDTSIPADYAADIEALKERLRAVEYETRRFRVVGVDDVEVAYGRYATREAATRQAHGMNALRENWDRKNKRCRPPYRVQTRVDQWVDKEVQP
jgi:hypothetical protein